ncbi:MAG: metal-dependent hydrolase [Candidatus Poribacteria bacterium]|nr:metal-dependent hydrolase [Candidatus Poribacteria bacterium]MDE0505298.1 metal-dependent hydrolase [Candidatus Poribacteria bacterium]
MSMFREHYIGGLVAYTLFFVLSLGASLFAQVAMQVPLDRNPTVSINPWNVGACFVIAVLSGLWPDVDIKSRGQQIFYRIFLIFSAILILRKQYLQSAILGIFAMLPLLGKHRGWTHSRLTMLLLPAVFLVLPFYFENAAVNLDSLNSVENMNLIRSGLPFYTASLIGYATHLHLDGILLNSRRAQGRTARSR